jgi:hypothetical protein
MAARPVVIPRSASRVLFVGGSLNQTTIVHKVARELPEVTARFTPFYADGPLGIAARNGLLDFTVLAGQARRATLRYFEEQGLRVDDRGAQGGYDLAVMPSDLVVPRNLRGTPLVLVQEGMMDPEDWRYRLVRGLRLPRYLANTSMTGLSHAYELFCVASEGWRGLFVAKGVRPERIRVTGIPNFDDVAGLLQNDFPHRGYVMAATSCLRETLKPEDRVGFLRRCLDLCAGRPLLVKLHPNEDHERAEREVRALSREALVFRDGNTSHMVANCEAFVTRYSSVVLIAAALGKDVHSDIEPSALQRLVPLQNGGTSARRIADLCRELLS